jgi:hypothetical protein
MVEQNFRNVDTLWRFTQILAARGTSFYTLKRGKTYTVFFVADAAEPYDGDY